MADAMDGLDALGFRDGESAVTFRTHAELVDILEAWFAAHEKLRAMGAAAAKLAHAEHTWAHRAQALREALAQRI